MNQLAHSRVKIIPSTHNAADARLSSGNSSASAAGGSNNGNFLCLQFALHGLVPRQLATPPARTLFFCVASQQLFPDAEALSTVCADPVDFSRICAKHGRGGEVPRPDFVSGYTRALPVAQHSGNEQHEHQQRAADSPPPMPVASKPPRGKSPDPSSAQHNTNNNNDDEQQQQQKQQMMMLPRWVFVAEARVLVSEHMMACLLGETSQRFVVLYTSATFQRNAQDEGGKQGAIGVAKHCSVPPPMGSGGNQHLPRFPGQALAHPLRPASSSNSRPGSGASKPRPEFTTLMHHSSASSARGGGTSNNGNNNTTIASVSSGGNNSPGSTNKNQGSVLSREECVSVVELSPELLDSDLNVQLGPHDRSWLFRFSNAGRRHKHHASFEAAKQLCGHRMHLGDEEMLRTLAKRFNEFLIGATQDTRRFCSFHAARMKVPIVFDLGMRSPQCQVFLQFLRESRRFVCARCIPEPPPHLVAHVQPPEFLEEKPLVEVIANLSLRFFTGHNNNMNTSNNSNNNSSSETLGHFAAPTISSAAAAENSYDGGVLPLSPEEKSQQHQQQHQNQQHAGGSSNRFAVGGHYGPESRSVFSPWRIEWLDFLLLTCVESRLWREVHSLLERFFELTDAQLLRHPDYVQEEHLLRINLFANVGDIERATGHGLQLEQAVKVATRCAQYCKASQANRALVLRIRHMTRVPYFQRVLFDSSLCMFEELCPNAATATVGRILWCCLVPLRIQKQVTAVIGARDNGVPMVTTPTVAARQFRAFVLSSTIGDEALKGLIKRKFVEWVTLIRDRRLKRKQAMQLQMTVRTSMVQNADSRKRFYMRWLQFTMKQRRLRQQGKLPPLEKREPVVVV